MTKTNRLKAVTPVATLAAPLRRGLSLVARFGLWAVVSVALAFAVAPTGLL